MKLMENGTRIEAAQKMASQSSAEDGLGDQAQC